MKVFASLLLCLFAVASADIQFSRTIDTVAPGIEGSAVLSSGCTSHDQYGSNDCTLNWGEKLSIAVNATLGHDIVEGSTFSVDAKVDGLLPLNVSEVSLHYPYSTTELTKLFYTTTSLNAKPVVQTAPSRSRLSKKQCLSKRHLAQLKLNMFKRTFQLLFHLRVQYR